MMRSNRVFFRKEQSPRGALGSPQARAGVSALFLRLDLPRSAALGGFETIRRIRPEKNNSQHGHEVVAGSKLRIGAEIISPLARDPRRVCPCPAVRVFRESASVSRRLIPANRRDYPKRWLSQKEELKEGDRAASELITGETSHRDVATDLAGCGESERWLTEATDPGSERSVHVAEYAAAAVGAFGPASSDPSLSGLARRRPAWPIAPA